MHCIIKYIVQGKQARVENADLRHRPQFVNKILIFSTGFRKMLICHI